MLSASNIVLGGDEDPLPEDGRPIHPLPQLACTWMGPNVMPGGAGSTTDEVSSNGGSGDQAMGEGFYQEPLVHDEVLGNQEDHEFGEVVPLVQSPLSRAATDFAA